MKRLFLFTAIGCLVLFVIAGLFVGELIPSFGQAQHSFSARRVRGPSVWSMVQNISAVVGIASFLIQIVQWRRHRRS